MARKKTIQKPKTPRVSKTAARPARTAPVASTAAIMLVYFAFYGIIYLFKKLEENRSEEHE